MLIRCHVVLLINCLIALSISCLTDLLANCLVAWAAQVEWLMWVSGLRYKEEEEEEGARCRRHYLRELQLLSAKGPHTQPPEQWLSSLKLKVLIDGDANSETALYSSFPLLVRIYKSFHPNEPSTSTLRCGLWVIPWWVITCGPLLMIHYLWSIPLWLTSFEPILGSSLPVVYTLMTWGQSPLMTYYLWSAPLMAHNLWTTISHSLLSGARRRSERGRSTERSSWRRSGSATGSPGRPEAPSPRPLTLHQGDNDILPGLLSPAQKWGRY